MSWASTRTAPAPARSRGGGSRLLARAALVVAVVVLLALLVLGYVGWRAQQVVGHLRSAAGSVPVLTGQLTGLDAEGAAATATGSAVTSSPPRSRTRW